MNNNALIEKIIEEVSLDDRVADGMFNIFNNDHMDALREFLIEKKGLPKNLVNEFSNLVIEKGKYPDRQAYNIKGILVTFPTPEYKQRAIARGTHFETDPTIAQANVFNVPQSVTGQPASTVPVVPAPVVPNGQPVVQPAGQPVLPMVQTPPSDLFTGNVPVDNVSNDVVKKDVPIEAPKTEQEKEVEKSVIKKMMRTDDNVLDEAVEFLVRNDFHWVKNRKQ